MIVNRVWAFLFIMTLSFSSWAGGSVIGNGGDPVFHFLETARFALVETLKVHALDPSRRSNFCSNMENLNKAQIDFCREFIEQIRDEMLLLNNGSRKVKFSLVKDPLYVPDEHGKPVPVAARTLLGPRGDIEFHRGSVQFYSPSRALFLLAHELGHKVSFNGKYINDFDAVGPFANGRELLDTMGETISNVAKELGKIGTYFGLRDFFRCEITFSNNYTTGVMVSSPRFFYSKDFLKYQAGLSRTPEDPEIFVYESDKSKLIYRIKINEENGCRSEANSPLSLSSRSELNIVRVYKQDERGEKRADEVIQTTVLDFNPICQEAPGWLVASTENITFSCLYVGTQGATHNNLRLLYKHK